MLKEPGLADSLWYSTAGPSPEAPLFTGNAVADVAIIGGGYTGCSAALHLARLGKSVIVLEAKEFGWGGSGRNAGMVNAGLWLDPNVVIARLGTTYGERLMDGLNHAPKLVFDIVERYGIDCDLVRKGVIKAAHNRGGLKAVQEHVRQWRSRGADIELFDAARAQQLLGTDYYLGGLIDHRSATIQPLSYARGLARAAQQEGAKLHSSSPALGLESTADGWQVSTQSGAVRAEHVILATNVYSDKLWPGVRESTVPVGAFFYATEPLGENIRTSVLPAGHSMYDTKPVMTFARFDREHRLLIGSLGGLPSSDPTRPNTWVNRLRRQLFPQLEDTRWSHKWSGSIGFTPDHVPRLHEPATNLYVTLGYNGRGIAPGTFWGKQLAERIAAGRSAEDMPLPVTALRPIAGRTLRKWFYRSAFWASRLRS
jgi:glycine/D-amino acid oxidase-like deaminating enzyme